MAKPSATHMLRISEIGYMGIRHGKERTKTNQYATNCYQMAAMSYMIRRPHLLDCTAVTSSVQNLLIYGNARRATLATFAYSGTDNFALEHDLFKMSPINEVPLK